MKHKRVAIIAAVVIFIVGILIGFDKKFNEPKYVSAGVGEESQKDEIKEDSEDKPQEDNKSLDEDKRTGTNSSQIEEEKPALEENKEDSHKKNDDSKQKDNTAIDNKEKIENPKPNKSNNKLTIVIDPGHASRSNLEKEPIAPGSSTMKIKDGGGATGISTKTPEYKIVMNVGMNLKSDLQAKGYNVVMTKEDVNLSLGNVERAEIGNKIGADLVIRLHCDSYDGQSAVGASMLVPNGTNENTKAIAGSSKIYGKTILDTYCSMTGIKNRGLIFSSDMTGFNWSKVPVVLIEMGFLSNPKEDALLSSEDFQKKAALAISAGIDKAFEGR